MNTRLANLPISYRSIEQDNGKYRVLSVPIFSETIDERGNGQYTYDRPWLEQCANRMQELESKGHFKSIHLGHHEGQENLDLQGHLSNVRVESFDGKAHLFADLANVNQDTYTRLVDGAIPHRSVEISDPSSPCISSLALLSTQDPYHEYPNLVVSKAEDVAFVRSASGPALFCKRGGTNYGLFLSLKDATMSKQFQGEAAPAAPPAAPAAPAAPVAPPMPPVSREEFAALQQMVAQMQQELQSVIAGKPAQPEPPAAAPPGAPAQMSKGKNMDTTFQKKIFSEMGALGAEISQLKSALKGKCVEENVENLVAQLYQQKSSFDEAEVRKTASYFAKLGPEALEGYANSMLRNTTPSATAQPDPMAVEEADPALAEYRDRPNEVKRFAKQNLQLYRANRQRFTLSESDFVAGQVNLKFQKNA